MTGILFNGEISADNCRIDGELLPDADHIRILDVVPLGNLQVGHAKALTDAAQNIAGGYGVYSEISVFASPCLPLLPPARSESPVQADPRRRCP